MKACQDCGAPIDRKSRRCHPCHSRTLVTHGMTKSRLFRIFTGMMARCGHYAGAHAADRRNYIDRGITVCPEWRNFTAFSAWATSNGYKDGLLIDRINGNLGYSADNCRWTTVAENARNRVVSKLTHETVTSIKGMLRDGVPNSQIAREFAVDPSMISHIKAGRTWAGIGGVL